MVFIPELTSKKWHFLVIDGTRTGQEYQNFSSLAEKINFMKVIFLNHPLAKMS